MAEETPLIEQQVAEQIAQQLNLLFNNATLYGGSHPSTMRSASKFAETLQDLFSDIPLVTLLRIGESLYIDKWCVDQKLNVGRLLNIFQRTGIESISFESGISAEDIRGFIVTVSDIQLFPSVDNMKNEFARLEIERVRLNYVFYQKVTEDDTVVTKDTLLNDTLPGENEAPVGKEQVLDQVGRLISLNNVLDHPEYVAGNIVEATTQGVEAGDMIVNHLRHLNATLHTEQTDRTFSVDEMLESVLKLSTEVRKTIALQKEMGKVFEKEEQIIEEVDQLTYQTIIKLVCEEYNKGDISLKRLSQIIRRILPDVKDLKKLLPQLKNALLAEGMPLKDFLQLTNELNRELENDSVIDALEESAEHYGMTTAEIVEAIRKDPHEATKIMVLASELKQQSTVESGNISKILSDYIESSSCELALDYHESSRAEQGSEELKNIITHLESHLTEKLKVHGVSDSVVIQVEKELAQRFPKTLEQLKADWIVSFIANNKDLSNNNVIRLLSSFVENKNDLETIRQPIEEALSEHGLSASQIEEVFGTILEKIAPKKRRTFTLPKYVLNNARTKFFIDQKVKESCRYNNDFSTLCISVSAVQKGESWQPISENELAQVIPEMYGILQLDLRDIDLIGSTTIDDTKVILIILPMTNEAGAMVVKKRLYRKFSQVTFPFGTYGGHCEFSISVTAFDKERTDTIRKYVRHMKKRHREEATF